MLSLFSANLSQLMQGFFDGHCSYNKEEIVYYKSPILITNINGSTVCGGTSHRIYGKYEYCEKMENSMKVGFGFASQKIYWIKNFCLVILQQILLTNFILIAQ